jgi:hypothetical protein
MIVIKLQGGLGNQMFQYAFGVALAEKYQDELTFELGYFKDSSSRQLGLSYFNTIIPEISEATHNRFYTLKNRILKKLNLYSLSHYIVHYQQHFNYYSIDHKKNKTILYVGYWQSPINFQKVSGLLKQQFTLKTNSITPADIALVSQDETVAIHVRRGDYLIGENAKVHTNLSIEYYIKAVEKMQQLMPQSKYIVFSDDIEWVIDNLKIPVQWQPMHNQEYRDVDIMMLMSKCSHQIIANSTFSWWAAWLNINVNKIIIRPKNWFANGINESDLIPDTWIII